MMASAVAIFVIIYLWFSKLITPRILAKSFMLAYDENMSGFADGKLLVQSQVLKKVVQIQGQGQPPKLNMNEVFGGKDLTLQDVDIASLISKVKPIFIGGYARSGELHPR